METSIYYRFIMHNPIRQTIMHNQTVHNPMCMEGDLVANIANIALIVLIANIALIALVAER